MLTTATLFSANPKGPFSVFITQGKLLAQRVIAQLEQKLFK